MRQPGGGVCRLHTPIVRCAFPEEGSVDKSLSYQARREGSNMPYLGTVRHLRHRNGRCWMPLWQQLDTIVPTPGGCSTMQKRCNEGGTALASMGQTPNTRCSGCGTPPPASAPNGLS